MDTRNAILSVIFAENGCLRGSKRLQKLTLLGLVGYNNQTGEDSLSHLEFYIHHHGPFSRKLATSTDELILDECISVSQEPVGSMGWLVDTYKLQDSDYSPNEQFIEIVKSLSKHGTVPLEVAATIQYYIDTGNSMDLAVEKTKRLKPRKSDRNLSEALKIVDSLKV